MFKKKNLKSYKHKIEPPKVMYYVFCRNYIYTMQRTLKSHKNG